MKKLVPKFRALAVRMPLEKFIPSAFIVFLLVFIILSIITYQNINEYKSSMEWIDHTNEVQKNTEAVNMHLTEMQINRRGLILKKDEKYFASYNENKSKANYELSVLKELTKDNPRQHTYILLMDSLAKLNIFYLDSTITLFRSNGIVNEQQTPLIIISQNYLEEVYQLASDVKSNELELLTKRRLEANSGSENIQLFIVLTSVLAFLVIGLSLVISNRLLKNKNIAEKLLKRSYDELEDKVEERTAELSLANESLIQEINSRIKAEYSLRESEERFRTMADFAPVLIWMSGRDKECNYFNKGWLDYTGRTMKEETGSGWSEGVYPEDLQKTMETYIMAFEKKEPFEMEYRLRNSMGEYRWIFDKGIPRYEGNDFAGYIGCCIDIHSRKINERYLRIQHSVSKTLTEPGSTEHILNQVLQDICQGVDWHFGVLWRTNGSTLYPASSWSSKKKNTSTYTGKYDESYRLEKGKGLPGIVWRNEKSLWIQDIEKDNIFLRRDDALEMGWKSAFAVPINNGSEVVSVIECFNENKLTPKDDLLEVLEAVGRQIGNFLERKKAEDKLRQSYSELEDRVRERTVELANTLNKLLSEIEYKEKIQNKLKLFGHAIKSIKECVYITDLDNNVLFVNSAFESLFGYYEEELKSKKNPVLFSEELSIPLREEIATRTIRSGWKGELKTVSKDNEPFYIYLSTSVIRNDEGKIEAIVGICQDITLSRIQEELIKKRNGLLKLLNDVITVANKSFELEISISYAINKVCQYTSFEIGHCYLVKEGKILWSAGIWNYDIDKKYELFVEESSEAAIAKGVGLIGTAYAEAKSIWIDINKTDVNTFTRKGTAQKMGLQTAICVPIMKQTEVIGILEFFISAHHPVDNEMLECISNIGIELGSLAERIAILEQIRTNEKHFKAVADTANDAIITVNRKGEIIYINNTVEKLFGYSSLEIINRKLEILMPERYIEKHRQAFESTVNTGHSKLTGQTLEFSGKRKNGEEFPIEISIAEWEINNEHYFTGMIKDITVRKEIEKELIDKQRSLIEAQKIARLGSWEWIINSNIVRWSDEMYSIFEVPAGTVITNEKYLELLDEDAKSERAEAMRKSLEEKKPFNYYLKIKTPRGKFKILNSLGEIEMNDRGESVRMVGTVIDVTELKEAEEKIRKSEKSLIEAQQIAKLGSWEFDLMTGRQVWSDEMYRIYGFSPGEIEPDYNAVLDMVHPADLEQITTITSQLLKKPGNLDLEYRIITKSGRLKFLNVGILVEYGTDSKPVRMYGSVQDITEIKLVEEELRETNEKLIEAQKELVHNEKLAALGRFSSGIAHEIRNPLANISALAQLLNKTKLDEKSRKHLSYILVNTDIANKIIKDLLNFASPEDLVFKEENISVIIDNLAESARPRCKESGVEIETDLPKELRLIKIDKVKFENAMLNFISNAIDAMPSGGKLTITAEEDSRVNGISIKVIDSGIGISPENIDKILEPFYTTKEEGTGLGLGLAYQTIKSHKGTLNIQSTLGKGTTVEIKLPIS